MKFFIIYLCLFSTLIVASFAIEKIKLSEISTLTLYANHKTNGRRSPGVQQLECIGGTANCDRKYLPNVVQCKNVGSDGYDVQWTCKAELETTIKFGTIDVSCEGYDYPNDKYVLKGSCGLRYTLDRKSSHGDNKYNYNSNARKTSTDDSNSTVMTFIGLVVIIIIVAVIVSNLYKNTPTNAPMAPPAPGFRPEYTEQPNYSVPPPPYSSVYNDDKYNNRTAANDGPGFWTGLGAGGLMGYLFGSSTNTRNRGYNRMNPHSYTNTHYSDSYEPPRRRSSSPKFRTASGFGGTSRR